MDLKLHVVTVDGRPLLEPACRAVFWDFTDRIATSETRFVSTLRGSAPPRSRLGAHAVIVLDDTFRFSPIVLEPLLLVGNFVLSAVALKLPRAAHSVVPPSDIRDLSAYAKRQLHWTDEERLGFEQLMFLLARWGRVSATALLPEWAAYVKTVKVDPGIVFA